MWITYFPKFQKNYKGIGTIPGMSCLLLGEIKDIALLSKDLWLLCIEQIMCMTSTWWLQPQTKPDRLFSRQFAMDTETSSQNSEWAEKSYFWQLKEGIVQSAGNKH